MPTSPHIGTWDPSRPFTWRDGERTIRFGRGVASDAAESVGSEFTLLTSQRGLGDAPGLARVAEAVHVVGPGLVDVLARDLRHRVRGGTLIALGGGRVIDVAKALAAADPPRRVVAIPTTLSGAEMTAIHRMVPGLPPGRARVRPSLVLADPLVMASLRGPSLAATAMNALGHAVEAPLTPRANPVAVMAAHRAAILIVQGLPGPDADALALGAILAGYAIGSAGYGLHHVLSQTLARHAGVGHGQANAAILPHSLAALSAHGAADAWPAGLDLAAAAASGASAAGAGRLRDLGVDRAELPRLAAVAAERSELRDTPGPADAPALLAIYEAAW